VASRRRRKVTVHDRAATATVLTTLRDAAVRRIQFRYSIINVNYLWYRAVAQAIQSGRITVWFEPRLSSTGEYDIRGNRLLLKYTQANSISRKMVIVHEATHAACDIRRQHLGVLASESLAYLAGAMYNRWTVNNIEARRVRNRNASTDRILSAAWQLSGMLLAGHRVSLQNCIPLFSSLARHPGYAQDWEKVVLYNGI
jgi:hypothetical protein